MQKNQKDENRGVINQLYPVKEQQTRPAEVGAQQTISHTLMETLTLHQDDEDITKKS